MINIQDIPKTSGIYKITSPSGKIYIGQSVNINKRFKEYNKIYNCKSQIKLYNSLIKYGFDAHTFDIIEECSIEQLNERERYWQDYYDVLNNGLNCKLTQIKDKSGKLSKETCNKKSLSMKGKYIRLGAVLSEETKDLMSIAAKNIPKPWLKGRISPSLGKKKTQDVLDAKYKAVVQYDLEGNFIREFKSILEAAKCTNIHKSNISNCVRIKGV